MSLKCGAVATASTATTISTGIGISIIDTTSTGRGATIGMSTGGIAGHGLRSTSAVPGAAGYGAVPSSPAATIGGAAIAVAGRGGTEPLAKPMRNGPNHSALFLFAYRFNRAGRSARTRAAQGRCTGSMDV